MKKTFFTILLTFCLAAAPAIAMPTAIGVSNHGGALAWSADFAVGQATLTVSGPSDFYSRLEFDGEMPSFDNIGSLADGSYTWELLMVSPISAEDRARLDAGRTSGRVPKVAVSSVRASGGFAVRGGQLIFSDDAEPTSARATGDGPAGALAGARVPTKSQTFTTDVIVQGSLCVGLDCVSSESFGFDTLRLKENNLRIHFQDTSASASFPSNDWRIIANDSSNGGANYLGFEDSTAGRIPFRVEAGAPVNTLYVEADGDVGVKTANPAVDIHIVEGNTPTLRLEQDGSDGFTPQTFDVAANEANFFVRDVTNGSKLSFRIRPGAPESSIDIAADGDVGVGTSAPDSPLHVRRTANVSGGIHAENANGTQASRTLMQLTNNGQLLFIMDRTDGSQPNRWFMAHNGDTFDISRGGAGSQITLDAVNNTLSIPGSFVSNGTTLAVPDYVFDPTYELMPLAELESFVQTNRHLPNVPSATEVKAGGLDLTSMQLRLLEKVEELTLYTLDQQGTIESQQQMIQDQAALLAEMRARLDALADTP